jgi:hypothetical protein
MAEPGAGADGGRDAGFPGLSLSARPPLLLSFRVGTLKNTIQANLYREQKNKIGSS